MKENKIKKSNLKKIIREEIKGVMSDRPFDFLDVEVISEEAENVPQEEQLEEGLMDDPDCARFARRKYDEYGGSPFEYYDRCMEARKSRGGGSSPSYAPTGWARKSSLDHMSDIGRFEEGKIKKNDLVAIIREELTKIFKQKEK